MSQVVLYFFIRSITQQALGIVHELESHFIFLAMTSNECFADMPKSDSTQGSQARWCLAIYLGHNLGTHLAQITPRWILHA
jgi:hypothetical protein